MILLKNLKYFQRAALGFLTMSALAGLLQAQSYYGRLRGAVVDQNGGAVPNASGTLTNEGTAATILIDDGAAQAAVIGLSLQQAGECAHREQS